MQRIMTYAARLIALGAALLVLAACTGAAQGPAETPFAATAEPTAPEAAPSATPFEEVRGSVPAPEFPTGLDWINGGPFTLADLRGKVVLLDFWTYGCINCIHMFPVLARLEEKYADELVIISVHSAKFVTEGETENLRQIVQRYNLQHPVVNDNRFVMWDLYRANAWPTFVLIDPEGMAFASDAGELPFDVFDRVVGAMVATFDAEGKINRDPVEVQLEGADRVATPLLFPGKVLADAEGGRLFIADSNHHRIVVADLATYEVLDVIGEGRPGLIDGSFEEARFTQPQGMAVEGDMLYVADTNNHAIRALDLNARTVRTIAGTGLQGRFVVPPGEVFATPALVDLRSPWDVALGAPGELFIAMAGAHQIWRMDLEANTLEPLIGSAREQLYNDTLARSGLAQPSGLYYAGGRLYFADSESSSIRVAELDTDRVLTLAGPEQDSLFTFGDTDGPLGESRLQHPLGVTGGPDGLIFFADTYNSRIKAVDPLTTETVTHFGLGGEGGFRDGGAQEAEFDEPGGLSYTEGRLYVADTNNHAIRVIDLEAGTVSTVMFPNPERLQVAEVMVVGGNLAGNPDVLLEAQTLAPGAGEVVLALTLPEGYKINPLIDSTLAFSAEGGAVEIAAESAQVVVDQVEVRIPATFVTGEGTLGAELTLYYCREGAEALCFIERLAIQAPVTVRSGGAGALLIAREIVPPDV